MTDQRLQKHLPKELKNLVNDVVTILGDVIREEGGEKSYRLVDEIREDMVRYRNFSAKEKSKLLSKLYAKLSKCNRKQKHDVAHSYTLMLELINACEASYRTYKLRSKEKAGTGLKKQNSSMVFVLTAHPTEARTSENIELFSRIQSILVDILEETAEQEYLKSIIKHNLKLAWLIPVTRHKKPDVVDEANHLFSIIFRRDIFDSLIRADRDLTNIRVRTWVGGDKDGHPGVDEKVMIKCLHASRVRFVYLFHDLWEEFEKDIQIIPGIDLRKQIIGIKKMLVGLSKINEKDADRIQIFHSHLEKIGESYEKIVGIAHPRIKKMKSILKLFPGLVIPIELREDSSIIASASTAKKKVAIERMLLKLSAIADQQHVKWYAQGLIISMCESYDDVVNTMELSKSTLGGLPIPVIPLFETAKALEDSQAIVTKLLSNREYVKCVKTNWRGYFEVMLGYSDSSKGMGVLPSRVGIAKTIRSLDALISSKNLTPVFFHGSGGSVDRGGGSLKEQTAWWPKSALEVYKATIQGEMVERTFTSPEVTLSGIDKIISNFKRAKAKKGPMKVDKSVELFASAVAKKYVEKVNSESFFEMVEAATPYSYLNVLKLGSRPTKRSTSKSKTLDFGSIRAIPWILCWTQTRTLFPTWWGIGSVWNEIRKDEKHIENLKKSYRTSFLFASFLRTLGFTLSKIDLSVFELYLKQSDLSQNRQKEVLNSFQTELKLTLNFLRTITGERDVLWHKPWLSDSIRLRSSMIHPLNVLQIQANKDGDEELVRKTVAGISSGMMTTG